MLESRKQVTLSCHGQQIFGILHLPQGADEGGKTRYPAALLCHGFGGNKSGRFRLFVRLATRLAEAGIATLRFDFRGAGDSEGDFADTTISGLSDDVRCALKWLQEHPQIDPKRIGIVGRSLGGMIAVLCAAETPISSIVLWAPVFDAKPWIDRGITFFEHLGVRLNDEYLRQCKEIQTREKLKKLSNVPLLHIQGDHDRTIEPYHAAEYESLRKEAMGETKFLRLPLSGHDFANANEQEVLLDETVQWLRQYT